MRYLTAGESHGETLCLIAEGLPSGLALDIDKINRDLARRMSGYGRGGRMSIENDKAHFVAGVRSGLTTGAPIAVLIANRDSENWTDYMRPFGEAAAGRQVTHVRPGHADFVGCVKYGHTDARNVLERASARSTATVVALGAICRTLLENVGVRIGSHVTGIGGVMSNRKRYGADELIKTADKSEVRCMDGAVGAKMKARIDKAKADGDTLGGSVEIVISGLPAAIGSYISPERRLDAILSGAFMGVQAVKAVEIGDYEGGTKSGSDCLDEIYADEGGGVKRMTNRACGIEGGMSNGEDVVIRAVIKPIPTLANGVKTVDITSGESVSAASERTDVCAVPAAAVVLESVAARVIADELMRVTGGDTMEEIKASTVRLREKAKALPLKRQ